MKQRKLRTQNCIIMEKYQHLGKLLSKMEQKQIVGGEEEEDEVIEDDGIVPKARCACATSGMRFLCNCGYESSCAEKKCGSGGWVCSC